MTPESELQGLVQHLREELTPEKDSKGLGWGQEHSFRLGGKGALRARNQGGVPMGPGMWAGGGELGGR